MNSDQIADILGQLAHTTREIWGDGPADGEELTRQKEALGERYEKAFYLIYGGTFGDRDGATELYQHLMDGGFFISPASAKHHLGRSMRWPKSMSGSGRISGCAAHFGRSETRPRYTR